MKILWEQGTGGRVPVSNGSVALEDIEEAMAEIKFSGR